MRWQKPFFFCIYFSKDWKGLKKFSEILPTFSWWEVKGTMLSQWATFNGGPAEGKAPQQVHKYTPFFKQSNIKFMDVYVLVKETNITDIIAESPNGFGKKQTSNGPKKVITSALQDESDPASSSRRREPAAQGLHQSFWALIQKHRYHEIWRPSLVTAFRSFPSQSRLQPSQTYTVTSILKKKNNKKNIFKLVVAVMQQKCLAFFVTSKMKERKNQTCDITRAWFPEQSSTTPAIQCRQFKAFLWKND